MNLKLFGTGLAALAFLASSFSTQAADIPRPVYKGVRPVVAYYNWTGFYVGINAGYGFGTSNWTVPPGDQHQTEGRPGRRHARLQLPGRLDRLRHRGRLRLVGREGQRRLRSGHDLRDPQPWLATFRGRLGYAFDRWLPYITAGGAYGNVKATATDAATGVVLATGSKSQLGWTGGVGLEYAFLGNWTAKIEYLYVDLGSFDAGLARRS